MTWELRWNFNSNSLSPGSVTSLTLTLENRENTFLAISDFSLDFDFRRYLLPRLSMQIPPNNSGTALSENFRIPNTVVGGRSFYFRYKIHRYSKGNWIDLGTRVSPKPHCLQIVPRPLYKVFISRGLHLEDSIVANPISCMIREWGFKTMTIGIELQVSENSTDEAIRREIKTSDAVILIATPRFVDSDTLKRTFEWGHAEFSLGYGEKKPLLIFLEKQVKLGGLPAYQDEHDKVPTILFERRNLNSIRPHIDSLMPIFRKSIENKKWSDWVDGAGDFLLKASAGVITAGVIYGLVGGFKQSESRNRSKNKRKFAK